MEDIVKHKDAVGVQGDLARELISIVNDYRAGQLSLEEKNELVADVVKIYEEAGHADNEVTVRWVASAGKIALGLV
jgi:2,3-bisphosphoglycerate-independent phosphoglycerate mutase